MEQLIEKLKEFWGKAQQFIKKIHLQEWSKKIGSSNNGWSIGDVFAVFLRTFKLLMNMAFVFIFFGGVIGAGIGIGYAASLFSKVEVPKQDELVKQVNNISGISKLTYADGSLIAEVDNDLLRIPVKSDAISENVKKPLSLQRMRILKRITEWCLKLCFGLRSALLSELARLAGGQPLPSS